MELESFLATVLESPPALGGEHTADNPRTHTFIKRAVS
jgi:hypothetical protein